MESTVRTSAGRGVGGWLWTRRWRKRPKMPHLPVSGGLPFKPSDFRMQLGLAVALNLGPWLTSDGSPRAAQHTLRGLTVPSGSWEAEPAGGACAVHPSAGLGRSLPALCSSHAWQRPGDMAPLHCDHCASGPSDEQSMSLRDCRTGVWADSSRPAGSRGLRTCARSCFSFLNAPRSREISGFSAKCGVSREEAGCFLLLLSERAPALRASWLVLSGLSLPTFRSCLVM